MARGDLVRMILDRMIRGEDLRNNKGGDENE